MRSPHEYREPLYLRVYTFMYRWLGWLIYLSADILFGPQGTLSLRDVVDILLFVAGWFGSSGTPLWMYAHNIGTTPWQIAAGVGIYLGLGLFYHWHEEYVIYRS